MRPWLVALAALPAVLAGAPLAGALTPLPPHRQLSVHDQAHVLKGARRNQIEALNRRLLAETKVPIVVVTVPRLQGETIAQLAVRIGQSWGVGYKGVDEGVVVVVSVADRKIFIATGYGSEGYLPDGKVGAIRDRGLPFLHANDYSNGLYTIDLALARAVAAAHGVSLGRIAPPPRRPRRRAHRASDSDDSILDSTFWFAAVFGGFVILVLLFELVGLWDRCGGGSSGSSGGGSWSSSSGGGTSSGGFGGGGGFDGFSGGGFGGGGAGGSF